MLADTNERPGIAEQYETATNTSNLKVEADRHGAGDVLIAAGWSPSRVGGALKRLQSEFEGGQKQGASATDARLLASRLKSLTSVLEQVGLKAVVWGIEGHSAKVLSVVLWWLDDRCGRCTGRRFEVTRGTPVLSNRLCRACGGRGKAHTPHGQEGRRLANYMDSCLEDWLGAIRSNKSPHRRARNKVVDTAHGRVIIAAEDGRRR